MKSYLASVAPRPLYTAPMPCFLIRSAATLLALAEPPLAPAALSTEIPIEIIYHK